MALLRYLFHPNPGHAAYGDAVITLMFVLCGALVIASFVIRVSRTRMENPVTRRLSRSWASAAFWFGLVGLILTVARVEAIQFVAMRLVWVLWWGALGLFQLFQVRQWVTRHYQVVTEKSREDPLMKYLPTKKKR